MNQDLAVVGDSAADALRMRDFRPSRAPVGHRHTGLMTELDEQRHAPVAADIRISRGQLVDDELRGIAATLSRKFPARPRAEVEAVVRAAYRHLEGCATVTAHLIPLTLNRSRRLLRESDGARQTAVPPARSAVAIPPAEHQAAS